MFAKHRRWRVWTVAFATAVTAVAGAEPDSRTKINLPAPMQDHMLANMRDHLQAWHEIQLALARDNAAQAAEIAEQRLGMSSLVLHGGEHMAPYMPQPMQDIGTEMHRAASRFARVAQAAAVEKDLPRALESLSQVTRQCIACHAAYRIR